MGPSPRLLVLDAKQRFGPELQVSIGPRPHLSFLDAKQRVLDKNNKSLWVQDLTCPFVREK